MNKQNSVRENYYLEALYNRAEVNNFIGKNSRAIDDAKHALRVSKKLKDNKLIAQGLELLSDIYKKTSKYKAMKKCAEQSLKLFRKVRDNSGAVLTISHIGDYYLFTGNTNRALDYYKRAMKLNKHSKNARNAANNAISMG
ncbi:tetratricopeptide repeat protein, partial [candidate division WOR-3 bacterium]|nr:tetratricopeptide repeat protein [candidate division WOR-3 bacterium]